jgi:hypothetical protein
MIAASDITVSVPCLFPNEEPIWMMRESADRFGYRLRPYGVGEGPYRGWVDIKLYRLLEEAKTCPTSHLLYTDARDAWFLAGPEEVVAKYNALGCPPLMLSAQPDVFQTYEKWYEGLPWDMSKRFRYIGTPGMLCSAPALAEALQWMLDRRATGEWGEMHDDDPAWWCNFIRERPGELVLEHECAIFMNAGSYMAEGMWETVLEMREGRVYNKLTQQWPCVLHFNGGYSDALKGKWDRLEYYWRALGNTSGPPWERG